ncbi:hypothetical protein OSB04_000136 [Centaurea solstitialis]|uniref:Reverse transcriptase zinc-binding domain-containing protein n=1 Tax=Centaurea solstitialis TaxID=347529 RepID=A0AA38WRX9_9ASTR|nr:hypothetical protein OSB04_000136 [Centaurea solstitialis]
MVSRGIPLASTSCVFCDVSDEDLHHCFFLCPRVEMVWRKIWSWWGIASPRPTYLEFLNMDIPTSRKNNIINVVFKATCVVSLWSIWAWRNRIFHAEDSEVEKLKLEDPFASIQKLSGFWISNRSRNIRIDLDFWVSNPTAVSER